jgi:hypothetical protein
MHTDETQMKKLVQLPAMASNSNHLGVIQKTRGTDFWESVFHLCPSVAKTVSGFIDAA